jgi:hypothetical protein
MFEPGSYCPGMPVKFASFLVAMGLSLRRRLKNFDEMVRGFEANTEKSGTHFGIHK